MAENNQIIAATIKVDTGNSNANVANLNKTLGETKKGLADVGATVTGTGKEIEGATGNFKSLKEQMTALPGPLGAAGEGVNKLGSAFKALLANPVVLVITAIVGALALLYKAFTNTFEGAEKVEQIFAGVKAAAQALLDNLGKVASAIVKFFSFDFSGALADIKSVVGAAADAYNAMAKLTEQAQQLHKEQLQNDLEQAERAKKLAVLREQATDEDVPIAKRKAALKELQVAAEQNAKEDIDLAKRTAENKIAQLTLEKDGARKNQDEITKIKIEQINVETENANELRRINKQLTAAEKAEQAERTEAAKKSAEQRKKIAEDLANYQKQLLKLQNDNALLAIKDANDKEAAQLKQKIADQKKDFDTQLAARKINQRQYDTLIEALNINSNLQEDALKQKHNKEIADKEAAFQKELGAIRNKTSIDSIRDTRERERVELEIGYNEKLKDAITRYRDDQDKLQQVKEALQAELKAQQSKLEAKNLKEDQKKGFAQSEAENKKIIDAHNFEFDQKKAALDAQTQLVQDAFDQQIISEQDYNSKTAALSEARRAIKEQEAAHNQTIVTAIAGGLDTLAQIAGKQTAIGKALSIASTTINTYQSAIGAFKGMVTTIPGPVGIALGVVAAAGAVATGIAAVKKIIAVQIPNGGGGGGAAPSTLPAQAAPLVPPPQTGTKIDQDSIKGIGDATVGRTYVVDSDVKDNADRRERLNRAARLGG